MSAATESISPRLPLSGITVIDFGQIFQGPYATLLLAKSGADVIKIEPPHGEPLRRRAAPGKSATLPFAMLNQNKRAVSLNLKHPKGRELLFEMVRLYPLDDPEEIEQVQAMIRRHAEYTKSDRAWKVLALWEAMVPKFVKVYPNDYRRVIETQKRFRASGLSEEEAIMAAFEENAHDASRVGGK